MIRVALLIGLSGVLSSVIVRGILLTKSSLIIEQTGQHEVLY